MTQNPYQTPAEIGSDLEIGTETGSMPGIEFKSDWSPAGLRARRNTAVDRFADLGFGLVTIAFLISVFSQATFPGISGVVCLLSIIWVLSGFSWFIHLVSRFGTAFRSRYPGLAGVVRGRVAGGVMMIHGPEVSLTACVNDFSQYEVFQHGARIRPPMLGETLPISREDILRCWKADTAPSPKPSACSMLRSLCEDEPRVQVTGRVRGTDFRGERCRRTWAIVAGVSGAISLTIAVWIAYEVFRLPKWVLNPPPHYQLSSAETEKMSALVVATVAAVVILGLGGWHLWRMFRSYGDYSVMLTQQVVAFANDRVAYGYHHRALSHFQWTPRGLVVRTSAGHTVMIVPNRWFDDEGRRLVESWYSQPTEMPADMLHIWPNVT